MTAITADGESLESEEVMSIPSPYLNVMHFGVEGMDEGEFNSPTGIAVDKDGNIYVSDTDNHSIQNLIKRENLLLGGAMNQIPKKANFIILVD